MDLISLVVVLIVVGILLWLVNNYIPMEARTMQILNIVVVIAVILWLLNMVGDSGLLPRALVSMMIVLIVVGIVLWLVNSYLPMDARIKQILNVVVIIAVILWLISAFGILSGRPMFSVGRLSDPPPAVSPPAVSRPAVSRPAVSPSAVAGAYRGHLTEIKGSRQSGFDLVLNEKRGTLVVHEAGPQCRNASIGIFGIERDIVKLETMGVPYGCERSFALKVSDSGKRLTGTMRYESSDWDVKAERR